MLAAVMRWTVMLMLNLVGAWVSGIWKEEGVVDACLCGSEKKSWNTLGFTVMLEKKNK
jgi:hypothetical protein